MTTQELPHLANAAALDARLAGLEDSRQRQLDALPPNPTEVVAAAHRGSVERILEEVRAARHRVRSGDYGVCTNCSGRIAPARLELRPWATMCMHCSQRAGG